MTLQPSAPQGQGSSWRDLEGSKRAVTVVVVRMCVRTMTHEVLAVQSGLKLCV